MSSYLYTIGEQVTLSATFSVAGVPTSPTTVLCELVNPTGAITSLTSSSSSAGVYVATFIPVLPGKHLYRWKGTGAINDAKDGFFNVQTSAVIAAGG